MRPPPLCHGVCDRHGEEREQRCCRLGNLLGIGEGIYRVQFSSLPWQEPQAGQGQGERGGEGGA